MKTNRDDAPERRARAIQMRGIPASQNPECAVRCRPDCDVVAADQPLVLGIEDDGRQSPALTVIIAADDDAVVKLPFAIAAAGETAPEPATGAAGNARGDTETTVGIGIFRARCKVDPRQGRVR